MNSKLDGDGSRVFGRPPLNLVLVLDVSGSMNQPFSGSTGSKISVAKDCVLAILSQLKPDDAFGIVSFNDMTEVLQPLVTLSKMNQSAFKELLAGVIAQRGTQMGIGERSHFIQLI